MPQYPCSRVTAEGSCCSRQQDKHSMPWLT
jgi:hypothetical protein